MGSRAMSLAMLPFHLHPALHERRLLVDPALLHPLAAVVGLGQRHLGVVDRAEAVLPQVTVLEDPVVADLAVGSTGDDVLHAGRCPRTLGLVGGEPGLLVHPLLREPRGHQRVAPSVTPAKRSSSY